MYVRIDRDGTAHHYSLGRLLHAARAPPELDKAGRLVEHVGLETHDKPEPGTAAVPHRRPPSKRYSRQKFLNLAGLSSA